MEEARQYSALILGGARSGKSSRALALAESLCDDRLYVATAQALDDEMAARIDQHQRQRGAGWQTIEEPLELVSTITSVAGQRRVLLIDCLTLWLSNLMHHQRDVEAEASKLCSALTSLAGPVILVSNEVGMGLVPENALAREFRDLQGRLNQQVARACSHVEFVAAGLPLKLKP